MTVFIHYLHTASNPTAIAIHEARTIFPDVPIELVVSIGTGGFKELKSEPRIGWDGIIGQIINSATDGEQIHHLLEDVLGDGTTAQGKSSISDTSYMRFNPILGMPDEFPIGEYFYQQSIMILSLQKYIYSFVLSLCYKFKCRMICQNNDKLTESWFHNTPNCIPFQMLPTPTSCKRSRP